MITEVHYDFADGLVRGNPAKMRIPPEILHDPDGSHFMRIYGHESDRDNIPAEYSNRNRSTVEFTSFDQPEITTDNYRQRYIAQLRFHDDEGSDGVVFELFQNAKPIGGYGTPDSRGPVVIIWRRDGVVQGRANYDSESRSTNWTWGKIPAGEWHTFKFQCRWSHDPKVGMISVFKDDVLKIRIQRGVCLGPTSTQIPSLKLGLYGDHAVGKIDVKKVVVEPW